MQAIAYYLLQVMICSTLLVGYYWLFLRNERFHRYNRFYLLAVSVLCWLIPLVRIQLQVPDEDTGDVYRLMTVVADQQTYWEDTVHSASFHLGWEEIIWMIYAGVTVILLFGLLRAVWRIRVLLKAHDIKQIADVHIIMTRVEGTPFSFFKYIFWHTDIDLRSTDGQRMLEHELTHVREWHSADKIFVQVLLVFGWINPLLWLIKKELEMIHEFIADQEAVRDGDTAALASMLLTAIYPQQSTLLTNPFFFSPIKRRILMLTKINHPKFSYFRRVIVLPIAFLIVTLFAFRSDRNTHASSLSKTYTIVLDAGHGGEDPGARSADEVREADISLAIVKKMEALNTNSSIRFVLTRSKNEFVPLQKRLQIANEVSADLFLSVHADNIPGKSTPANYVYITKLTDHPAYAESRFLASIMVEKLKIKGMNSGLISRTTKGVYVLDSSKIPAAIIMAGNMSSRNQISQLKSVAYQEEMAELFLNAIEVYLQQKNAGIKAVVGEPLDITALKKDTIPANKVSTKTAIVEKSDGLSPMVYLDGKKIDNVENLNNINPNDIAMVNVLKGDNAAKKYGVLAKERGVVEVITKNKQAIEVIPTGDPAGVKAFLKRNTQIKQVYWKHSPLRMIVALKDGTEESYDLTSEASKTRAVKKYGKLPVPAPPPPPIVAKEQEKPVEVYDRVFTKVQEPASFPGGKEAWQKYLERNLKMDVPVKNGAPAGQYSVTVRFIVDEQGGISNIEAENDPGYGTAAEAVNLIKKGPGWMPAKQNGKNVKYWMKQNITFVVSED